MPDYRTPFPALLAGSLEMALNRILALDEDTPRRLARLDGRLVELRLSGLDIALFFSFTRYRVGVSLEADREPDAVIEGSPLALSAMALPDADDRWGKPGSGVRMSGDAALARDLERLFAQLDPDWERYLAGWFGDVAGRQLASGARAAIDQMKSTAETIEEMTAEYFARSDSPLARPAEIETFGREVGKLREATDRLEARIRVLAGRAADPADDLQ